jgi:DNA-binding transcriptional LysR family regulator
MWSAIELREIRAFLTLADERHFGRAAERLRVTPSRMSQVIRELEWKVGGRLLHRTSRRVELTELGARFLAEAGEAYKQLASALEDLDLEQRQPPPLLRLGLFSDPGASQIPRIVNAFETAHSECTVEAAEVPIDDPFGPLHRGEIDLVASWLPHGQADLVTSTVLSSEPRVLAVSSAHHLARRDCVSVEDLGDCEVMHFDTMPREFHEAWIPSQTPEGRPIRHREFSRRSLGDRGRMTSELVHLVATGRIVHPTVPSFANMFGHPDIVYVPIVDLVPLRSALVWRSDNRNQRLRDFARVAAEVVKETHRTATKPLGSDPRR